MSFKKCKVLLLPTNEKAKQGDILIPKSPHRMRATTAIFKNITKTANERFIPHHLYILSDEEIKEGDWCYDTKRIEQPYVFKPHSMDKDYVNDDKKEYAYDRKDVLKVIASTDTSLGEEWESPDLPAGKNRFYKHFPRPSDAFIQKFIEEYNKGNVIEEVMVEYERKMVQIFDIGGIIDHWVTELKISKDNTITIKKIKDSWTRKEVEKLCKDLFGYVIMHSGDISSECSFNKWKQENL